MPILGCITYFVLEKIAFYIKSHSQRHLARETFWQLGHRILQGPCETTTSALDHYGGDAQNGAQQSKPELCIGDEKNKGRRPKDLAFWRRVKNETSTDYLQLQHPERFKEYHDISWHLEWHLDAFGMCMHILIWYPSLTSCKPQKEIRAPLGAVIDLWQLWHWFTSRQCNLQLHRGFKHGAKDDQGQDEFDGEKSNPKTVTHQAWQEWSWTHLPHHVGIAATASDTRSGWDEKQISQTNARKNKVKHQQRC